ncbi:MAG: hypothetical protein JKY88_07205 [Pseudomonadales bacterium]|nr:hypothetical protein [Pseudomonadales bacterium]
MSCGFQLRGAEGYDFDLGSIHISALNTRSEMVKILADTLSNQGVDISSKSEAPYSLSLLSEITHRRPVATSGDISVSEYELSIEVRFQVLSESNQVLIPPTSVIVEKIYSFDASSLVGSSEEETQVVAEIRRDISGQILRRLYAAMRIESENP